MYNSMYYIASIFDFVSVAYKALHPAKPLWQQGRSKARSAWLGRSIGCST